MPVCSYYVVSKHPQTNQSHSREHLHDVPADKADTDHESPARDLGEAPNSVTDGDVQAVLGERAVEGVEDALVGLGLLVRLLKVDGGDLGGGDCGAVDVDGADGRGGRALVEKRLGKLQVEDTGRADGPGVAEDTVLVAVQVCEVGRVRGGREEGDTAIEGLLGLLASSKAGGIAAGDKDHPLLDAGAGGRGAGLDELLVVGEGELLDLDVGDLCGGGVDRVGD